MPRYRSFGQLDDPFIEDGDQGFIGLDAQTDGTRLQPGFVQFASNIRFDSGVAKVRPGLEKIKEYTESICSLVEFRDPDGTQDILAITPDKVKYVTKTKNDLNLFETVSENATGLQLFGDIIVFDAGKRPQISNGTSDFVQLSATPSINDGAFKVCPNAPFGTFLANRLIVPDYADSPTTILISDILDPNLFQIATGEFFINKGTQDITLAFAQYQENQLLCLNATSVHLVSNIHSLDSASFEITRQFGIAGTRAFCQSGAYTYFMSSEGDVQVLVPSSDPAKGLGISISKVTVDQLPLSAPIQPIIDNINFDILDKSILHYHKNRVYVSCGIDSSNMNSLLVYNSLLSQWESVDILPINIVDIISHRGRMYIADENNVYEYGSSTSDIGLPITAKLITRDYMLGTRDIKKFVRGTLGYASETGSGINIIVATKNPDKRIFSKQIVEGDNDFDRMTRFNTRQRGFSANVEINAISGLTVPTEIRRVSLEGFVGNGRTGGDFDGI